MMARLLRLLSEAHAYTGKHCSRVARFSLELAKAAGLSSEEVEKIRVAGGLHDLGKIGIGKEILDKPSKLTAEEYEKIKQHPVIAQNLLREMSFMMDVVNMVYYHHERYGGGGYPEGLKGEDIPLGARIICIADAFDAMTTVRSYNKVMSTKDAAAELNRCAGTQFDPWLVDLFIRHVVDT